MSNDIRICKQCGVVYEFGFLGRGIKYCSKTCANKSIAYAKKYLMKSRYKKKCKPCVICGRDITTVGKRKKVNKYCSKTCMNIARDKFITIKIPVKIEVMKTVTIPIYDIPQIFNYSRKLKRGLKEITIHTTKLSNSSCES